jgi:hypothetical protein
VFSSLSSNHTSSVQRDAAGGDGVVARCRGFDAKVNDGVGLDAVEAVDDKAVGACGGVELWEVVHPHLLAVKIIVAVLCIGGEMDDGLIADSTIAQVQGARCLLRLPACRCWPASRGCAWQVGEGYGTRRSAHPLRAPRTLAREG